MSVSAAEVDELRRAGEARGLDDADTTLQSVAENLGFLIHQLRHLGADQAQVLHDIELLARAAEFNKSELREARDVLRALNYPPAISQLLTALARRAPPRPPPYFRGVGHQCASALHWIEHRRAAREKAAADAGSPAATRRSTSA
jgi:hypothetical protein